MIITICLFFLERKFFRKVLALQLKLNCTTLLDLLLLKTTMLHYLK
uniref:Uncharacterized protein n=1 Tax=Arundo donax TaxID=35708 RepID=A0A0A8Y543_ARUDO